MDEKDERPKKDDDIGIPVVPLVLGGMLATGPIMGTGILPFVGLDVNVEDKIAEKDQQEDELRK